LLHGVHTPAIEGDYTDIEALRHLLAGTGLMPVVDPESGTLGLRRVPTSQKVIALPPFLVEENLSARPWRHASLPGLEVLSHCPDEVTRNLVAQYYRLHALLDLLVPPDLQGASDVPVSYILYDTDSQTAFTRKLVEELQTRANAHGAFNSFEVMPNFRLWDADSLAIFFSLDTSSLNRFNLRTAGLSLTGDYVRCVLAGRRPALPAWFIDGMTELYRTVELSTASTEAVAAGSFAQASSMAPQTERVAFRRFVWISPEETGLLDRRPDLRSTIMPLSMLFAEPAADESEATKAVRRAEAALFIRWMFDPNKTGLKGTRAPDAPPLPISELQPAALWNFVHQAAAGPVTEAVFKSCFGLNYAAVETQLRHYQLAAIGSFNGFHLPLPPTIPSPEMVLRDATLAEISRIKGRLERLDVPYVQTRYPDLVPRYVEQARSTLRKAYDEGDRDPRLLAELGLCEVDAGDDPAAQSLLTAAAVGHVVHPRVYCELVRIDYQDFQAGHPATAKLPAETATRLLGWLDQADAQAPAMPESYLLRARVLIGAGAPISANQLAAFASGLRAFPRQGELYYAVALLHAMAGKTDSARELAERALAITTEPQTRGRLQQLLRVLPSSASEPSP
jgi:hypothetical protein